MGASVQPETSGDRIARNIAAMQAQGASEKDIEAYLTQHEGLAPQPADTKLSLRNLGRSAVQGATLGWGDELGLTSRDAQKAFGAEHPIADFIAKLGGGMVAPVAAVAAAPALGASLGGAALLGAGMGAVTGAGEAEGGLSERAKSGAVGGLLGGGLGAAGYGAVKGAGAIVSKVLDRMHPERVVKQSVSGLLTPAVTSKLAEVDAIAPGGASIATASVPASGEKLSRLLPMLRAVGANPEAGAAAEANLSAQKVALETARKGLGAQMDAITTPVPVTPELQAALKATGEVLGGKTPQIGQNATHVDIQELRDALSRLRFKGRALGKQGPDANGMTVKDVTDAENALKAIIYKVEPAFANLDKPYSVVMSQLKNTESALKTVQRSRSNYAANAAYGATSGSLGGSLPSGTHGVVMTALDKVLTNKAGAADAVARLLTQPGGPALVQRATTGVPKPFTVPRSLAPTLAGSIPAIRGLLSP